MIISFHIGMHATDEDQLVKSLLKNTEALAKEGIAVPGPGRYRNILSDATRRLRGAPASPDTREMILDSVLDQENPERVVFSYDCFIGAAQRVLDNGILYQRAGEKTAWLRNVFPDDRVEFFLAVRNPATWLPAMAPKLGEKAFADFTRNIDPDLVVWSDVVRDIRESNPDSPITVWCNEDTPLIWPEVMHQVTGLDPEIQLMGGFDILSQIMAKEGLRRVRGYLGAHPPLNENQRRRVLSAFLDKYAIDEEIEEEVDLPGWTPELVEHLTAVYDDDMIEIGRIPGVTLLTA